MHNQRNPRGSSPRNSSLALSFQQLKMNCPDGGQS
jgi:hypothetical protein